MGVYTDGTHLIADTVDELHVFALIIGLKVNWFQPHPKHPHYDITSKAIKQRAINNGAILVTSKDIINIFKKK